MTYTTTGTIATNIELARELAAHFISELHTLHHENEHITQLLDVGDEYDLLLLPGESLEAIVNNLKIIVMLACEPVPMPTTGRDRVNHHYRATHQRQTILLFAQVALALLNPAAMGDHRAVGDETPDVLHATEPAQTVCQLGSAS